jgi:acyl-CoA hydrolase
VGIGGMPNAVCTLLLESSVRDLGVHTEMLTDGIVELYKAGRISGTSKTLNPGKIVYDFALGSSALYATVHRNPDLSYPVDYMNSPHIIARNDRVISINNTTQIDLQGQATSESDGHRHISGTGGQCSSCAARMLRMAGSRSYVWLPPTTSAASVVAGSSWS